MGELLILLLAIAIAVALVLIFLLLQSRLRETFKSLSADALVHNNQAFIQLAKMTLEKSQVEAKGELKLRQQAIQELVTPLKQTLESYTQQVLELERKREQAYGGLRQYLDTVSTTQMELRRETGNLVKALRASHVRGKWGEIGLRRLVELAGMVEHCDFKGQESIAGGESRLRPDLIVYLPNDRKIVVDAKVPLDSYLSSVEAESEAERDRLMAEHSHQLQRHVSLLASRSYWDQLGGSPEFVVMFLPLESLYSAALRLNPNLLEDAIQKKVILATPTTLIALLKAVDHGWKQEKLTQNAERISALGKELYDRLYKVAEHLSRLGSSLDRSVQAYNETVGSFESRVLVQARRFRDLGIAAKEDIPEAPWIDRAARHPQPAELAEPDGSTDLSDASVLEDTGLEQSNPTQEETVRAI